MNFLKQFVPMVLKPGFTASYDGVPGDAGQCVQLVELFWKDVTNTPVPRYPDAATYWEKDVAGWMHHAYKPGLQPQTGDVVIWDRNLPGSNGHGHIDICFQPLSQMVFEGIDSNWVPLKVTKVQHSFGHCLGWLRQGS